MQYNTLSKQNISFEDIETGSQQLNKFVDTFENLYGRGHVTINLHLLRHLPMCVQSLGPLWATSAYVFEANNGVIVKGNTSLRDIVHQLTWKYVMKKTIVKKEQKIPELSFDGKRTITISLAEKELLVEEGLKVNTNEYLNIHRSVTIRGTKYTSEH